jgi:1-acyl-sn-glycerol-3-phosphate acyltransferase
VRLPRSFLSRPAITVRFGQPFTLSREQGAGAARTSLTDATDLIMRHIAALLPESYRGIYATPATAPT